jgi:chromosome partitioning protein
MRTIAVVNQKGGCGKTTTAINLSGFLALEGRRVLLVDLDPQGHATLGLSPNTAPQARTMYEVLLSRAGGTPTSLQDVTRPVLDRLDIAPADILLSAAPEKLSTVPGRESILAEALEEVRGRYEYVVIDCPPNVGLLTFNALMACSEAIVPVDPSFFSLHGIAKVMETFELVARQTGHRIASRVLVTLYSSRTQFARDVLEEIRRHLGGSHFETVVRHSMKLAEAASHGVPIANYCTHCAGYADYRDVAAEVTRWAPSSRVADAWEAAAAAPVDLSRAAAPTPTAEGVVFTVEAPSARRVQLVGDFNAWELHGSEMKRMGPVWQTVVPLQPGRYRYRYVVDGEWRSDPWNSRVEPTPYGGHNSVLVLNDAPPSRVSAHAG